MLSDIFDGTELNWSSALAGLLGLQLLYTFVTATWNVYFHPLRHFPGPKLWLVFPLWRHIVSVQGRLDLCMCIFHQKYGDVVRFGPNEVSFITAQSWKDIYGHSKEGRPQLRKLVFATSTEEAADIVTGNDAEHSRFRKALAHGFSAKGMQGQEPLLRGYVDQLIGRLRDNAVHSNRDNTSTDMVKWYNLTTFDMIGDLAFGASFGGLQDNHLHDWVATLFNSIKVLSFIRAAVDYPLVFRAVSFFLPASLSDAKRKQVEYVQDTVIKRLSNPSQHGRGDFIDSMTRHRGDKDGLTDAELVSNANILVIAGSETTATLLAGATYWLLRTPHAIKRVTSEVRSAFNSEEEITFQSATQKLPYMLACLEEAFRMYPPVPAGLQRLTPAGAPTDISGYAIAPGTKVSVHQLAAFSSPTNFHNPSSYAPERWLPSATTDPSSPFYSDNRDVLQPFSVGPRNCIGRNLAYNEMRLILARVLWNFDMELDEEKSMHWDKQLSYTLWDKPALFCRLEARDRAAVDVVV